MTWVSWSNLIRKISINGAENINYKGVLKNMVPSPSGRGLGRGDKIRRFYWFPLPIPPPEGEGVNVINSLVLLT
jgi:hypothetical protein